MSSNTENPKFYRFSVITIVVVWSIFNIDTISNLFNLLIHSFQKVINNKTIFPVDDLVIQAVSTGVGIVIGNTIINYVKNWNQRRELAKTYIFLINNQVSQISVCIHCLENIQFYLQYQYSIITQKLPWELDQKDKKRVEDLWDSYEQIHDCLRVIEEDELYKSLLIEVKTFLANAKMLEILEEYFAALRVCLFNIDTFFRHNFPESKKARLSYLWMPQESIVRRIDYLLAQLRIANFRAIKCLNILQAVNFSDYEESHQNNLKKLIAIEQKYKDDTKWQKDLQEIRKIIANN